MENEMTLKEAIDRLKLFGLYFEEAPTGAIEVIIKAFEQRKNPSPSDLISRKEALEAIKKIGDSLNLSNKECTLYGKIYEAVENMTVAYDVDKVVEDIEKRIEFQKNEMKYDGINSGIYYNRISELKIAIEIVKGGLKE